MLQVRDINNLVRRWVCARMCVLCVYAVQYRACFCVCNANTDKKNIQCLQERLLQTHIQVIK